MRGLYVIVKWVFLGKEKQGRNLFKKFTCVLWASLIAQWVKNLPAMQETWVRSLDWEDPLGKANHCSILA